tara:strand:+ start:61 stop:255 length:195 start_codon:yes stop_codon:yes gene_type:complete
MPHTKNVHSFDDQNTNDAKGKGNTKKKRRLIQPFRGIANFLNEESAATRNDFKTLRRLKNKPKY